MLGHFSHAQLFATSWAVVHHGILSMGFSRQKYWYGLPFPSPRDLRSPGLEPESLMSPALAGQFFTTSATWEAPRKAKIQTLTMPNASSEKISGHHRFGEGKDE